MPSEVKRRCEISPSGAGLTTPTRPWPGSDPESRFGSSFRNESSSGSHSEARGSEFLSSSAVVARTDVDPSLVAVVSATAHGDVPERGFSSDGIRDFVVELQEAALGTTAAVLGHESARPAITPPHPAPDLGRNMP
jgi:hypothetical protein